MLAETAAVRKRDASEIASVFRLTALSALVTAGQSCRQIAELFGENGTTVQRWVRRFEHGGLEALREGERSGRPSALDAGQWRKLQGDLRKTPRDFGIPATLWDGPVLSEHLRRHYRVHLGVRQCQRLFRRMGFRLRKPRPQVAQADPLKIAAAKKTSPPGPARRRGAWTNVTFNNTARAIVWANGSFRKTVFSNPFEKSGGGGVREQLC